MALSFFCILIQFFFVFICGKGIIKFIESRNYNANFITIILSGTIFITTLGLVLHLFIPISAIAFYIQFVCTLGFLFYSKTNLKDIFLPIFELSIYSKFIFFVVLSVTIFEASDLGHLHDEYLYYQPSINWIYNYKAILGLANLHGKLGFGSSWFIYNGFFNFRFLGLNCLNEANGFITLVVAIYSLQSFDKVVFHGQYKVSHFVKILILPFLYLVYFKYISCPSPDFISSVVVWILVAEIINLIETKEDNFMMIIAITSIFVITLKITNAAIGIFGIYFFIDSILKRKNKQAIKFVIITSMFMFPWFTRNVIQTGYLIYPATEIDLFNVDWKVPKENYSGSSAFRCFSANDERKITLFHSRGLVEGDINEGIKKPFEEWYPLWLKIFEKVDFFIIPFCILSFIFLMIIGINKYKKYDLKIALLILAIHVLGVMIWYFNGPSPRYLYSFFCLPIMIGISVFVNTFLRKKTTLFLLILSLLTLLSMCNFLSYIKPKYILETVKTNWLKPRDFNSPETLSHQLSNNAQNTVYTVKDYDGRCELAQLPCARFLNPNLFFRGLKIEDGFKQLNIKNQKYSF